MSVKSDVNRNIKYCKFFNYSNRRAKKRHSSAKLLGRGAFPRYIRADYVPSFFAERSKKNFVPVYFLNGLLIKFYNSEHGLFKWDCPTCYRKEAKTNRTVQTDHLSHTISFLFDSSRALGITGETVDFIAIYREEPLLSNTRIFNMLK